MKKANHKEEAVAQFLTPGWLRTTGEKMAARMKDHRVRHVDNTVRRTRAFIKELAANPRETLDGLSAESRELFDARRKETRLKVDRYVQSGRLFYRQAREDPRGAVGGLVGEGKDRARALGAETRQRLDVCAAGGRELFDILEKDSLLLAALLLLSGQKMLETISGTEKSEPLLVKKYANGRFFDSENKTYLKKADLVRLIRQGRRIRVLSTKTGEDITDTVVSGLAVESPAGEKTPLSLDAAMRVVGENRKKIREVINHHLDNVRRRLKFPV